MSNHYRLRAVNDVVISSANSGKIVHQAEIDYAHANDSLLKNLKELKGSVSGNEILRINGSGEVSAISGSDFVSAYASDFNTSNDSRYAQLSGATMTGDLDLGSNKLVFGAHNISVSGGYLTYDDTAQVAFQNQNINVGNNALQDVGKVWFHSSGAADANELKVDVDNDLTYQAHKVAHESNIDAMVGDAGYIKSVDLSAYQTDTQNESKYLQINDQYVQSVSAPLACIENNLTVDLSAYQQTSSLDTDVNNLGYIKSVDLSAYQTDTQNESKYLQITNEYIQSVQAASVLSVSGSELQIDLSAYETQTQAEAKYLQSADLSTYLQTDDADVELKSSFVVKSSSGDTKNTKWVYDATLGASPSTVHTLSVASNKLYNVSCRLVAKGELGQGCVVKSAIYKLSGGNAVLVSSSDNSSVNGACDGSEMLLSVSSSNLNVTVQRSTGITSTSCAGIVIIEVDEC